MSCANRLLVVSHVPHYRYNGSIYAYGPYVREINIWCDLFPQVTIASPCANATPPGDCLPLTRENVDLHPIRQSGGKTIRAKIAQLLSLPAVILQLARAMSQVDAIHVRCPGNLGMLGVILAPLFSKYLIAKYAGQWGSFPKEPTSCRWTRWLLRSRWWRGPVTVYGEWQNQPQHIIPFFTSVMTAEQVNRASRASLQRRFDEPLSLLYVGRLSKQKNVHVLLDAVALLNRRGIAVECEIVGDGAERDRLERMAKDLGIYDRVCFSGAVPFEDVFDHYERADVLVLVSETEGWPKVIAEAMAFGLICIGSDRGLVPWLLGDGRGFVVPPGDVAALSATLEKIAASPGLRSEISEQATVFGQGYSLESLRTALRDLLSEHWNVDLHVTVQAKNKCVTVA